MFSSVLASLFVCWIIENETTQPTFYEIQQKGGTWATEELNHLDFVGNPYHVTLRLWVGLGWVMVRVGYGYG